MKNHEAVTLLIRDIANPSSSDPFFPVFRHKVSRKIALALTAGRNIVTRKQCRKIS